MQEVVQSWVCLRTSEVTCMFWVTTVSFLLANRELSDLKQ